MHLFSPGKRRRRVSSSLSQSRSLNHAKLLRRSLIPVWARQWFLARPRRRLRVVLALLVVFFGSLFSGGAAPAPSEIESTARWLASHDIEYSRGWVPPGETTTWAMDCSNAVRWLTRELYGKNLPRTASAQYETLRGERKFRRARPDARQLAQSLRPGDLLFWEHTYRPQRNHPVTHVMVYLGTDARGRLLMAGSQSSRGPDVYRLDPAQSYGGYGGLAGLFRREGRLIAFGRLPGVGK